MKGLSLNPFPYLSRPSGTLSTRRGKLEKGELTGLPSSTKGFRGETNFKSLSCGEGFRERSVE